MCESGGCVAPPPDPVNVLLSFGYTLLTRELEASVALVNYPDRETPAPVADMVIRRLRRRGFKVA